MKISHIPKKARFQEQGSATILVLALVGIMLIVVGANIRTLNSLKKEMNLIEKKQIQRWENQSKAVTNDRSK